MKNSSIFNQSLFTFSILALLILFSAPSMAQEETKVEGTEEKKEEDGNKPVRPHFESSWIIDNQTVSMRQKGTFEFMIQHRFGSVSSGLDDLYGLYLPSNIRLGFNYTVFDKLGFGAIRGPLAIGFGSTKDNRILDFNLKYGILTQTRNGRIPISVSYYVNTAMETVKSKSELPNGNTSDRYSYFHQLLISRRLGSKFSLQIAPSVSHYNTVEPEMQNDHFAVSASARFKFSTSGAFIVNIDQPITKHKLYNPHPNFGFGIEMGTSAHSFQLFATTYSAIVQQRNNVFNYNNPWGDGFLIGFNIDRLWNF